MGQVGSKRQSDPYDGYPKTKSKNTDKLKQYYSLNERINNLTNSLTGKQEISQVEAFFKKELREINASTGNESSKDIQKSLFNLKDIIREKFNSKESNDLAFQIYCTAQGLTPTFKIKELPNDVQKLIFYQYGTDTEVLEDLSDDFGSENAISARIGWINANHISLKEVGCKNAKEAIKYVIDHNLISANLSQFQDLTDEDLRELCNKCPYLESLSIEGCTLPGQEFVKVLGKMTNLRSLDVGYCTQIPGEEFVKVLGKMPNLQSLSIVGCTQLPGEEFVKVLGKMPNLRSLDVSYCTQLPGEEFVKVLGEMTNLQSLYVSYCTQLPGEEFVKVLEKLPNLRSLDLGRCTQIPGKEFVKVLEKMTNLQSLNIRGCTQLPGEEFVKVLGKMTNLQSLDVSWFTQLPGKEFVKVLGKMTNLRSLYYRGCDKVLESHIKSKLPHLFKTA